MPSATFSKPLLARPLPCSSADASTIRDIHAAFRQNASLVRPPSSALLSSVRGSLPARPPGENHHLAGVNRAIRRGEGARERGREGGSGACCQMSPAFSPPSLRSLVAFDV